MAIVSYDHSVDRAGHRRFNADVNLVSIGVDSIPDKLSQAEKRTSSDHTAEVVVGGGNPIAVNHGVRLDLKTLNEVPECHELSAI